MSGTEKNILTINGGSSSIKFALFSTSGARPLPSSLRMKLKGQIARIGMADTVFSVESADQVENKTENFTRPVIAPNHAAAIGRLMDWLEEKIHEKENKNSIIAVGHRVVHGGPHFYQPQRLTSALLKALRKLSPLDPEHLPTEILLIETLQRRFPDLPQIVCFDTAFHHDLPRVAQLLPIPRRYEAKGVRRYGFHGLSFSYLMAELRRREGAVMARGRIILLHLGNGVSLAAVKRGKPLDTSMGFTPASGVLMGTRAGDLDPGIVGYLARSEGLDVKQFDEMINFKSGLLGVSETSADMQDLLQRESADPRAAEAIALFCYQIKKAIGAFSATLGGLDTLIFAGGIGEQAPTIRARICKGLGFLGVSIDPGRNHKNAEVISTQTAQVKVLVMRTNEELVIANSASRILKADEKELSNHSLTKSFTRTFTQPSTRKKK